MMIGPDSYYDLYLKDKSEKEIRTVIRGLKQKIGHLKNVIEHPDYQMMYHPSEYVQICCNRLYLEKAIQTLKECGYEYIPSNKELRAMRFQENIPYINKITLEIGGIFQGFKRYGFVADNNEYKYTEENIIMPQAQITKEIKNISISKKEFMECIKPLYLGEWLSHYDLNRFGIAVMDGTQWRLQIEYSNNTKKIKVTGDNAYPYNFNYLEDFLVLEDD